MEARQALSFRNGLEWVRERHIGQNELSLILTLPLPGATAQWRHKQPRSGPG